MFVCVCVLYKTKLPLSWASQTFSQLCFRQLAERLNLDESSQYIWHMHFLRCVCMCVCLSVCVFKLHRKTVKGLQISLRLKHSALKRDFGKRTHIHTLAAVYFMHISFASIALSPSLWTINKTELGQTNCGSLVRKASWICNNFIYYLDHMHVCILSIFI